MCVWYPVSIEFPQARRPPSWGRSQRNGRHRVASGKGDKRAPIPHYDPISGRTYPVATAPTTYLTWFDPDGAMNGDRIYRALPPGMPTLLVVSSRP